MVQGVREKCLILGIFQLPLKVYFPHSPTLHALWLLGGFGQWETPTRNYKGWRRRRARHLPTGSQCSVISEAQMGAVSPVTATALLHSGLSGFQKVLPPSALEMAIAPCRWFQGAVLSRIILNVLVSYIILNVLSYIIKVLSYIIVLSYLILSYF